LIPSTPLGALERHGYIPRLRIRDREASAVTDQSDQSDPADPSFNITARPTMPLHHGAAHREIWQEHLPPVLRLHGLPGLQALPRREHHPLIPNPGPSPPSSNIPGYSKPVQLTLAKGVGRRGPKPNPCRKALKTPPRGRPQ